VKLFIYILGNMGSSYGMNSNNYGSSSGYGGMILIHLESDSSNLVLKCLKITELLVI